MTVDAWLGQHLGELTTYEIDEQDGWAELQIRICDASTAAFFLRRTPRQSDIPRAKRCEQRRQGTCAVHTYRHYGQDDPPLECIGRPIYWGSFARGAPIFQVRTIMRVRWCQTMERKTVVHESQRPRGRLVISPPIAQQSAARSTAPCTACRVVCLTRPWPGSPTRASRLPSPPPSRSAGRCSRSGC